MRCRWCVGFACEVDAKNGTHNTVIPAALATGNCELREAIQAAEDDAAVDGCSAGSGADTIVFAPALAGLTIAYSSPMAFASSSCDA